MIYCIAESVWNFFAHDGANRTIAIVTVILAGLGIWQNVQSRIAHRHELRAYIHTKIDIENLAELNKLTEFSPGDWGGDVLIEKGFEELPNNPPRHLEYRVSLKNYGKTPAHKVLVDGRVMIAKYPLALDTRKGFPALMKRKDLVSGGRLLGDILIDGSLGPEGEHGAVFGFGGVDKNVPIQKSDLENLILGKGYAIYIYGHVEYLDAFGMERITNFCYCHRKDKKTEGYPDKLETWINGNEAT